MDGIFVRRKGRIWLILLLIVALFAARYLLRYNASPETAGNPTALIVCGVLLCLFGIPAVLMNRGAYIHIDTETRRMSAKYNWFCRIDCNLEDIDFAYPQINTSTILLKNGKRHVVGGVENSADLSETIRRETFALERESPETLRQRLTLLQAERKKRLWWVVLGCVLLFVNIAVAVLLTGGRDFHEFEKQDWLILTVMGAAELATMVLTFRFAERCGKQQLPLAWLQYRLRNSIIATQPLPSNQTLAVYTDENCRSRILICGLPNDESVYYEEQKFSGDMVLETVYTSKFYSNREELETDTVFGPLDITGQLLSRQIG